MTCARRLQRHRNNLASEPCISLYFDIGLAEALPYTRRGNFEETLRITQCAHSFSREKKRVANTDETTAKTPTKTPAQSNKISNKKIGVKKEGREISEPTELSVSKFRPPPQKKKKKHGVDDCGDRSLLSHSSSRKSGAGANGRASSFGFQINAPPPRTEENPSWAENSHRARNAKSRSAASAVLLLLPARSLHGVSRQRSTLPSAA